MSSKEVKYYGPWALVTGATSGIGKDFAQELAKKGFSLVLVARTKSKLEELSRKYQTECGVETYPISVDISQANGLEELLKKTTDLNIGLVVHAAGFGSAGSFSDLDLANELNMVDLNCRSTVQLSHGFCNRMRNRGKSGLVLFGSLVGFQGSPWSATYSATKAFVQSFAEALYHEEKGYGIDVLSVAPGPVETGFGSRAAMQMGMAQSSEGIAKECLKALGRQMTVRPGFLSKFLGYSLSTAPRPLRVTIMKGIMGGMVSGGKK
ncbi:SDR family NAD(P)-dependent oxidoreductase [Leptospira sp. WS60.C2]